MLKGVRERHGADSIGVIGSSRLALSEAWALRSLAEDVLGTRHFGGCSCLGWLPLAVPGSGSYGDIEGADLIMVIGADLLEENPILGARVMSRTKPEADRPYVSPDISHQLPPEPAALIWVNSRPGALAESAAVRVQVRPGREWIFLAALVQKLAAAAESKARGLDGLRESMARVKMDRLLEHAGIAAKDVSRAADMLGSASRPLLMIGRGLWQQDQAGLAKAALVNMALMRQPLRVMQAAAGANDAWCGPVLGSGRGLGYMEMIEAAGSGRIKALVLVGEDPLRSLPGNGLTARALAALEVLVVMDSFSTNRAIPMARAVIPMPLTLEKAGVFRNIEGGDQEFSIAVSPPPGVRSLRETFDRLARTMGGEIKESGKTAPPEMNELRPLPMPEAYGQDPGFLLEIGTAYPQLMGGELLAEATPHLAREFSGGWAEMNPDDIAELGLRSGWRARFSTEAGKVEAVIRPNPGLLRKSVFMAAHFGANALAPFRYDPETKTPVFRGIPVGIEKI
jgi:predicted molibdopterin-dependent oxidoreductase YjgC